MLISGRSSTKENPLNLTAVKKLRGRPLDDHLTTFENITPMGKRHRCLNVLFNEKNGHPLLNNMLQDFDRVAGD